MSIRRSQFEHPQCPTILWWLPPIFCFRITIIITSATEAPTRITHTKDYNIATWLWTQFLIAHRLDSCKYAYMYIYMRLIVWCSLDDRCPAIISTACLLMLFSFKVVCRPSRLSSLWVSIQWSPTQHESMRRSLTLRFGSIY